MWKSWNENNDIPPDHQHFLEQVQVIAGQCQHR
jgi:hypothetical protein